MKLFLVEYMNKMEMSEFYFFGEAYEWKYRHLIDVSDYVDEYLRYGIIPNFVEDYIRYIQTSFQ